MRVYCCRCHKPYTKSPNQIKKWGRTPETYICRNCRSNDEPRHTGPQTHVNRLKEYSEQYKIIHGGCFAGRD